MEDPIKRAPDFLGIGLQKAGTSWLYEQLDRHPDIWLPKRKELHFFDSTLNASWHDKRQERAKKELESLNKRLQTAKKGQVKKIQKEIEEQEYMAQPIQDLDWYKGIWSTIAPIGVVSGEITPAYSLIEEDTIKLIREDVGVNKVILILRDPVERSWSQFRMMTERSSNDPERVFKKRRLLDRGRAKEILERWEAYFSPEEIFIGFFEDIKVRPYSFLEQVCNFLEVRFDRAFFPEAETPVRVSRSAPCPPDILEFYREEYKSDLLYLANRFGGYPLDWARRHELLPE